MKGLASILGILVLSGGVTLAGPLELSFGGGLGAVSLTSFNGIIDSWNGVLDELNEYSLVDPEVSGSVRNLAKLSTGLTFQAAEWYWILDWLALGARFEYETATTATSGAYVGGETSVVNISLEYQTIGILAAARVAILDIGVRLSADVGLGYYRGTLDHAVIFQVPSEYPKALSGIPPEGSDRHAGGTVGFAAQLALDVPVMSGFRLGAAVGYRTAMIGTLTNEAGAALDLDGDEILDEANVSAISVRLAISLDIDLSLDGEKEQEL
ncbi:MAG: hypothetical protein PHX77_02825 [Candidatus Bipolaricaulis sp.]|nr:hypothetical protein [Candidatus Bipolaricaulis sp.]MDD5645596.1 hypothetical protein [Candidatus Bipolaricaulis sp.]